MGTLQENMAVLLTKISDMQNNTDNSKSKESGRGQSGRSEQVLKQEHSLRNDTLDSVQSNDSFEALRSKITNYLENVISQNQVIIEENQKLRQNIGKKFIVGFVLIKVK